MRPEVLIAGKPDQIQNYVNALELLGVTGISVFQCAWREALEYSGLVLPGGGDIAPELFGQINCGSRQIDRTMDIIQLKLLEEYCAREKPVLGICKGIQIINVYFGGTIRQHLPTAYAHAWLSGDQYHMTIARQGSFLSELYGLRFPVNSAHHQGIDSLGDGLEAIQFADDQVIEGIVHSKLPVIGVQWHPERMPEEKDGCQGGRRLLEFWIRTLQ